MAPFSVVNGHADVCQQSFVDSPRAPYTFPPWPAKIPVIFRPPTRMRTWRIFDNAPQALCLIVAAFLDDDLLPLDKESHASRNFDPLRNHAYQAGTTQYIWLGYSLTKMARIIQSYARSSMAWMMSSIARSSRWEQKYQNQGSKIPETWIATGGGAFDDEGIDHESVARYLPPSYAETKAGEAFWGLVYRLPSEE
ncbi:hypothetical protein C8R44DRAFT_984846 [Mycena epipterygia]|nr:hypothetical protein C8R44DRAFT_984846 [Mycena epipterygia]